MFVMLLDGVCGKRGAVQEDPAIPLRTLGFSEKLDGPMAARATCEDICRKRGRRRREGPKKLMESGRDLLGQEQSNVNVERIIISGWS